jgi:hypothetical protein
MSRRLSLNRGRRIARSSSGQTLARWGLRIPGSGSTSVEGTPGDAGSNPARAIQDSNLVSY